MANTNKNYKYLSIALPFISILLLFLQRYLSKVYSDNPFDLVNLTMNSIIPVILYGVLLLLAFCLISKQNTYNNKEMKVIYLIFFIIMLLILVFTFSGHLFLIIIPTHEHVFFTLINLVFYLTLLLTKN